MTQSTSPWRPGATPAELGRVLDRRLVLETLPDLPRWVEIRAMLRSGRGFAFGPGAGACVVVGPNTGTGGVVGRPPAELIRAMARWCGEILAAPEDAEGVTEALPGWGIETATLHLLRDRSRLPPVEPGRVRLLEPSEVLHLQVPEPLRAELLAESRAGTSIAAAFAGGRPVSFCYAGSITEQWWDIGIETLPAHRRRGHASACVAWEIERLARQALQPVWGAAESNGASLGLADRLGFVPHDRIVVLTAPPSAGNET